jgi:hypothetical protein
LCYTYDGPQIVVPMYIHLVLAAWSGGNASARGDIGREIECHRGVGVYIVIAFKSCTFDGKIIFLLKNTF